MRKLIFLLVSGILFTAQADAARGRQPCSGSKGGIAHCTSDGRFVCNDGSLSQSKRFCSGYVSSETSNPVKPSTSSRKAQTKKVPTAKKQKPQRVAENDEPVSTQPRQPTCAPLYMVNKPGYTHLPICSENQY
ncbi:YdcA family protein [Serratia sp. NA_112.1]|uniref:YdcA family protein n=1 Tax=unclassified Serratia (in: enterobacteria) TaxID=2647522 RepID=UPI004046C16F